LVEHHCDLDSKTCVGLLAERRWLRQAPQDHLGDLWQVTGERPRHVAVAVAWVAAGQHQSPRCQEGTNELRGCRGASSPTASGQLGLAGSIAPRRDVRWCQPPSRAGGGPGRPDSGLRDDPPVLGPLCGYRSASLGAVSWVARHPHTPSPVAPHRPPNLQTPSRPWSC
jgi:hypothetical protein